MPTSSNHTTVIRNWISNAGKRGVSPEIGSNNIIDNNSLSNPTDDGIYLTDLSENNTVEYNPIVHARIGIRQCCRGRNCTSTDKLERRDRVWRWYTNYCRSSPAKRS